MNNKAQQKQDLFDRYGREDIAIGSFLIKFGERKVGDRYLTGWHLPNREFTNSKTHATAIFTQWLKAAGVKL